MYNPRYLELLAQANLAPTELARAQQQGALQASNAQALSSGITGALSSLVGASFKGADLMQQNDAARANTDAQQLVANNASAMPITGREGPVDENGRGPNMSAADVAKNAVGADKSLEYNNPSDALGWLADKFTNHADNLAKARANATSQIASVAQGNQDKATALERQKAQDAIAAQGAQNIQEDRAAAAQEKTAQAAKIKADEAAKQHALDLQNVVAPVLAAPAANTPAAADRLGTNKPLDPKALAALLATPAPASAGIAGILRDNAGKFTPEELQRFITVGQEHGIEVALADNVKRAQAAQGFAGADRDKAAADLDRARATDIPEKAKAAAAKATNKNASAIADVSDFSNALANLSDTASRVDGDHIGKIRLGARLAADAKKAGGLEGIGGEAADTALKRQMTPDEQALYTDLAVVKAKAVKGLEGAHRTVNHTIEALVDTALNALDAGDIPGFQVQLKRLQAAADSTRSSIQANGVPAATDVGISTGGPASADEVPPWAQ